MGEEDTYKPVSCVLYDELELASTRKTRVHLLLTNGEELDTLVSDMRTVKHKGEFLTTDTGREIRLDEIKEIEGRYLV